MYTLVTSESSPYGRKVRIVMDVLGLGDSFKLQSANTQDPEDPVRQINPLGKIPALITDEGATLYDSRVIIDFLDAQYGDGQLIPRNPNARGRALTLAALAEGINDALLLITYEGRFREPEQKSQVWLDHQYGKIRRGLSVVVEQLDEFQPPDIAAITLACALGYADWRKQIDWRSEYPSLVPWLENFADTVAAWETTKAP